MAGLALGLLLAAALASDAAAQTKRVQLELLLAVDTSLSVSDQEFALQTLGLSKAFLDQRVQAAVQALGDDGLAVGLLQWGNSDQQELAVDWALVKDVASSQALAYRIAKMPRVFVGPGTAIGRALERSVTLFQQNEFLGDRRVIDISGDGVDNRGQVPRETRDRVVAQGITINGLAILNEDPHLDHYYRHSIIGGTGAFVMTALDYEDFAQAIVRKLVREISGAPLAGTRPPLRSADTQEKEVAARP